MASSDRPATRLATRLSFLVAGFGIACWAPLVPFAKQRLAVDDGTLGLLLLCIGIGSVVAMLLTGPLSSRYGSKPVILAGAFGLPSSSLSYPSPRHRRPSRSLFSRSGHRWGRSMSP